MYKNILSKLAIAFVVIFSLTSCELSLQKDYDYNASVADPNVNMTAWEYLQTRKDIFSEFIAAVEYTGLKDYYTQTGSKLTFLALTNTAMSLYRTNNFPSESTITTCDKTQVTNMLLYHIVNGYYSAYGNLQVEPMFVLTMLRGEDGLMTMLVNKNPWQADAGKIVVNLYGSNSQSNTRKAVSSNIMTTNGVVHVFDEYCSYKR